MSKPVIAPQKIIRHSFTTLRLMLPRVLLFELVYKILTAALFRPLIGFILSAMVRLGGYGIAFNADIWKFLLSPLGVITLILIMILAALVTYFEFSVIILLAHNQYTQITAKLGYIMKQALTTMRCLASPGIAGFCLYTLVVLPFINTGVTSSLLPSITIPDFIVSALDDTVWGVLLLIAAVVLGLYIATQLLYLLPVMVLEHRRFWPALKRGRQVLRQTSLRMLLVFAAVLAVWGLLVVLPSVLVEALTGVDAGAGLADILSASDLPWKMILSSLAVLIISIMQMFLMPTVLSLTVISYLETDNQVHMDIQALIRVDRRLERLRQRLQGLWRRLREGMSALWARLNEKPFFARHRIKIFIALGLILGLLVWIIYPSVVPWDDPIVIGHRGSLSGVENTLEAIQGAIDAGADYAEIDILLSSDGIPVVVHDANLKRLTGQSLQVGSLTAAELAVISLEQNGHQGSISTLEEVLEYCDGKIRLLIEYKLHGGETVSIVDRAMETVLAAGFGEQCIFQTLNYSLIEESKEKYPDAIIGYVAYGNVGKLTPARLSMFDVDFLSIEQGFVSESVVRACRRAWIPIYVWTTNTTESLETYLKMGVSGVITDYPALAKNLSAQLNRR